jgi:hypothetical protein
MIAEAKNLKPLCLNRCRASGVCVFSSIRKMLSAIELDHQSGCMAHEIGDVAFDRDLAPEAGAVQPMIPRLRPEDALGIGGVFPQCARV